MPNMKDLSVRVKKLWVMLKFFDGQTDRQMDGQTDRVITIGHPPNQIKAYNHTIFMITRVVRKTTELTGGNHM